METETTSQLIEEETKHRDDDTPIGEETKLRDDDTLIGEETKHREYDDTPIGEETKHREYDDTADKLSLSQAVKKLSFVDILRFPRLLVNVLIMWFAW